MLLSIDHLKGYKIEAVDGDLGLNLPVLQKKQRKGR